MTEQQMIHAVDSNGESAVTARRPSAQVGLTSRQTEKGDDTG